MRGSELTHTSLHKFIEDWHLEITDTTWETDRSIQYNKEMRTPKIWKITGHGTAIILHIKLM